MKFLKFLKYDIKQGFVYNRVKFLILFFVVLAFCILFKASVPGTMSFYGITENSSFADYILYVVEGTGQVPMDQIEKYSLPINWVAIAAIISYIVGYYAVDDLHTYGQQILIRSGSRIKWFLSKCVWNAAMVLLAYGIIYVTVFLFALATGADMDMTVMRQLLGKTFYTQSVNVSRLDIYLMFFVMPVLVSVTVSILQMVISIMFSPIVGYISAQAVMFGSTIFPYKFFIGNYSMFAKNKVNGMTQIDIYEGIVICTVVLVLSVAAGIVYFNRCNILSKE